MLRFSSAALALLVLSAAVGVGATPSRTLLAGAPAPAPAPNGCTTVSTSYQVILRTGATAAGSDTPLGSLVEQSGDVITLPVETSRRRLRADQPDVSPNPDFTSLMNVGGKLYAVTQFESPQPSAVYLISLDQDKATGKLTATNVEAVDFSSVGGTWDLCAGQLTPWGTHFGGEEYEPDARILHSAKTLWGKEDSVEAEDEELAQNVADFLRYYGVYDSEQMDMESVLESFNPYNFGNGIEVAVLPGGATKVSKWYTLGRTSKELGYIMPDNKTVYLTDDGSQVGFFKFVADKAGDLSSGTLSAAKFNQTSDKNGGAFTISWIPLGSANNAELEALVNTTRFSDIFEYKAPTNGTCPAGFKSINAGNANQECLKLVPGAEKAAAFLESRRYAAYLGATTEFSKWEGITYSPSRRMLFTAMTEIRNGMEDNASKGKAEKKYDEGGPNNIKLPYNPCGCVYALSVDSQLSATNMSALVCGYAQDDPAANKTVDACSVNGIGNPDNVAMMEDNDVLLIGEDASAAHQNDLVWAYDLTSGNLSRIFSTPYGAETTSPYFYPNLANGWSYITAVVQHPYGESDKDKAGNPASQGKEGYVGVFALPTEKIQGKALKFASIPYPTTEAEKSAVNGATTVLACPKGPAGVTVVTPARTASVSVPSPAPAVAAQTSGAAVTAPASFLLATAGLAALLMA